MGQGLECIDKIDLPIGHNFQAENLASETPHQVYLSKEVDNIHTIMAADVYRTIIVR
jgi:hypothetical protein